MDAQESRCRTHGLRNMGILETTAEQEKYRNSRSTEKKTFIRMEKNGTKLHRQGVSQMAKKVFFLVYKTKGFHIEHRLKL